MTTQQIWGQDYEQTVRDFTERNPDPADWVRGQRTDEAQRMRDVLTADIGEIPTEDLVTIKLSEWNADYCAIRSPAPIQGVPRRMAVSDSRSPASPGCLDAPHKPTARRLAARQAQAASDSARTRRDRGAVSGKPAGVRHPRACDFAKRLAPFERIGFATISHLASWAMTCSLARTILSAACISAFRNSAHDQSCRAGSSPAPFVRRRRCLRSGLT